MLKARPITTNDEDRSGSSSPKRSSVETYLPLQVWRSAISDTPLRELVRELPGPLVQPEHELEFLVTAVLREWDAGHFIERHLSTMTTELTASSVPKYFSSQFLQYSPVTADDDTLPPRYEDVVARIGAFYNRAPHAYWKAVLEKDADGGEVTAPPSSIFAYTDVYALFAARRGHLFGWNTDAALYVLEKMCTEDLLHLLDVVCYGRWEGGHCSFDFLRALVRTSVNRDVIRLEHIIGAGLTPIGEFLRTCNTKFPDLKFKGAPHAASPAALGPRLAIDSNNRRLLDILRKMTVGIRRFSTRHALQHRNCFAHEVKVYASCISALRKIMIAANATSSKLLYAEVRSHAREVFPSVSDRNLDALCFKAVH